VSSCNNIDTRVHSGQKAFHLILTTDFIQNYYVR
jgi:hypothetical protein